MKLAILASHPIQYQAGLFRRLASWPGVDLTVFFCWTFGVESPGYDKDFGQSVQWDIPLLGGYRHEFLRNYSPRPSSTFFGQINPRIFAVLRSGQYDALLIQGYSNLTTWLAFAAARLCETPVLLRGETDLLRARPGWKRAMKRPVMSLLMKCIDGALYSCSANREYFSHYGVPDEALFPFPCAVDNTYWREQRALWEPQRAATRRSLGIPESARVVLVVGKLIEMKRPADVLRAVNRINDESIWLVYVGAGPLRGEIEAEASEAGITDRVVFAGFQNQSQLGRYFAMADLLAIASEHDKSPKVLNEAMNFGLAIVAARSVSTARDLVHDGENGRLYLTGDLKELADAITFVACHPDRTRLGARSLEIVQDWSFEADIAGLIEAVDASRSRRSAVTNHVRAGLS